MSTACQSFKFSAKNTEYIMQLTKDVGCNQSFDIDGSETSQIATKHKFDNSNKVR